MTGTTEDYPSDEQVAPEIPDFDLLRQIGRGGFGRVWLARNRATHQLRAVKVISRSHVGTADPAGREIVSITRLEENLTRRHPNLLSIHHVGQTPDYLFYVMDLADDTSGATSPEPSSYGPATLQNRLADGGLSAEAGLVSTRELLQGLASLHEAHMVHRDVKPANCLYVDNQLKLADFGLLTKASGEVSRLGTEKYMPPDGQMDARADVYAAGLVVYEMITGASVDRFPQLGRRADAIAADPVLSALLRIALEACQPDPHQRFPDAGHMLAALDEQLRRPAPDVRLSRRLVIPMALIALAVAVTLGAYLLLRPERVHVNFITYPYDATILLDGKPLYDSEDKPAKTPCTIDRLPARPHTITFQHPQHPDHHAGPIDFRTTRQVAYEWESPPGQFPMTAEPFPAEPLHDGPSEDPWDLFPTGPE
jgi:hypothetical protein